MKGFGIGSKLPQFETDAFVNGRFERIGSGDVLGKWSVFFFYPADFTFVCPTELEDLASLRGEFSKAGAEIYAVSTDTHFCHKAWHDSSEAVKRVEFPMLGDPSGRISEAFGVLDRESGLAERGTFVADPSGRVVSVEVTAGGVGRRTASMDLAASESSLARKAAARTITMSRAAEACETKREESKMEGSG